MPDWPFSQVGDYVQRRIEPVDLNSDGTYCSLGIRYETGLYVRDKKQGRVIRTKMYRVRGGDFIYCILDTQRGPFDIVPSEYDSHVVTNKFPCYVVGPGLLPEFLLLNFQQSTTLEKIGKARQGSEGRSEWKPAQFEAHRIPVPDLSVQERIVDVIAAVDAFSDSLQREIRSAVSAREALLHQLVSALGAESVLLTLGDVANWSSGGTPKADNPNFYGGDIPWAIIGDIRGRGVSKTTRSITQAGLDSIGGASKMVPAGAVLVTMYGTIGNSGVADIPLATNQAICRGVPNGLVSSSYLDLWIGANRSKLIRLGEGKTQMNINKKKVESFPIRVPALDVQNSIVDTMRSVDDQIVALESEWERVAAARDALLDALLSGELDIDISSGEDVSLPG